MADKACFDLLATKAEQLQDLIAVLAVLETAGEAEKLARLAYIAEDLVAEVVRLVYEVLPK
ncbi:MAG: hypothetical protein LCI02_09640 [Proteobacteria bacterium]|nr:hypothetical protein [Pseudomonadota bacterium]